MRKSTFASITVVVVSTLLLVSGCGSSDSAGTTATFSLKGYAKAPAGSSFVGKKTIHDRTGSTVSCDGGATCCLAGTGCDPTMMNVTVYKAWLGTNADCSNAVLVTDNGASASGQDVTQDPTLISGSPGAGTYNCLILEISDTMTFKANQTTVTTLGGACNSTSTAYTFDIFRNGDSWFNYDTGVAEAGAGTQGAASAQKVTIYVSTNPTAISSQVSSEQKLTLTHALTVAAGSTTSVGMVVDFDDDIENDGGTACWMAPAAISFVNL